MQRTPQGKNHAHGNHHPNPVIQKLVTSWIIIIITHKEDGDEDLPD